MFKLKIMSIARRKSCICSTSCYPHQNKAIARLEMRELLINNEIRVYQMQSNLGLIHIDDDDDGKSEISNSFDYSDLSGQNTRRNIKLKTIKEHEAEENTPRAASLMKAPQSKNEKKKSRYNLSAFGIKLPQRRSSHANSGSKSILKSSSIKTS